MQPCSSTELALDLNMLLRRTAAIAGLIGLGGCYAPSDGPPEVPIGGLESTSLVLQAVDAGTGAALADSTMVVRYLVRTPIVFDASAVDQVPSVEPYRVELPVAEDSLVVEVRLEAASYHRLDTVFSVARGSEAGPLTLRLAPRLDRVGGEPVAPEPAPTVVATGPDRSAMNEGDQAFRRGSWLEATEAYQRMPAPRNELSEYGRAYLAAKVRHGVAHLNRNEYARALEIFEEAVDMSAPTPDAFLRLAQAQCAVGRSAEGRGTLAQVERMRASLGPLQQSTVSALIAYQTGVCTHVEFERAETTRERVRAGAQASQELNAFIEGARAMSPVPAEVYNAVQDAERRVLEIRRAMGD
jgi:hypothetical protein